MPVHCNQRVATVRENLQTSSAEKTNKQTPNSKSSKSWIQDVFPFIYVFFNVFQWCFIVFSVQVWASFFCQIYSQESYPFWCHCNWNCFLSFIFRLFIATTKLILYTDLYSEKFLNSFISWFLVDSFGVSVATKSYLQIQFYFLISNLDAFYYFFLFNCSGLTPPVQCWIKAIRVGILV